MLSPWLLLLTMARVIAGSRHPMDWPGTPEAPTCEQLRTFWETMSRMAQMAQVTNEIPVMSGQMQAALDQFLGNAKPYRKFAKDASLNLLDFTDQPPPPPKSFLLPQTPSDPGTFGEFHDQSAGQLPYRLLQTTEPQAHGFGSSPAVPLEATKNAENEFHIPQWGSPEEVGTFGSFVDFDFGSPHLAMLRTPKNDAGEWREVRQDVKNSRSSQVPCDVRMNTDCASSEQCLCKERMKLVCIRGRCLNHNHDNGVNESHGKWHDGALPQSHLQLLSSPGKRSHRSIFM